MDRAPTARYRAIADVITERIHDGTYPAGSWLPGTAELAAEFGVATNTLQSAMRVVTGRGLVIRRDRVGTMVTRAPIARTICLLVRATPFESEGSRYHRSIIRRLFAEVEAMGLALRMAVYEDGQQGDRQVAELARDAREGALRGLLAFGGIPRRWRDLLQSQTDLPWIEPGLRVDYRALAETMVGHLLAQGFHRILMIGGHQAHIEQPVSSGARAALDAAGVSEETLRQLPAPVDEASRLIPLVDAELARWGPDAVAVLDDSATPAVLMALLGRNRFPGRDVGLITHANRDQPILSPVALTRVEVDVTGIARDMLDRLEQVLSGKEPPEQRFLPMRLVIGDSSRRD